MPEYKSYTKESTSSPPAAVIRRGKGEEAQSAIIAGSNSSEADVLDSLRSGIDNRGERKSERNGMKGIQLDRNDFQATGMEETVSVIISSEGEVGEVCHFPLP